MDAAIWGLSPSWKRESSSSGVRLPSSSVNSERLKDKGYEEVATN